MELREMTAIVTGAGRGMGRAFAEELASRGATVAVCDVNKDDLEKTAAEIRKATGARVIAEAVDVSSEDQVARFVERVEKECGRVDILVNNAGIHPLHMIEDVTVEEWDRVLAVNVRSVFLFCRAVLPGMRKRRFGRIISVASEAGKNGGTIAAPHYCASKGAILAFTRNLARAVGADGVTVNALAPGRIATAMAGQVSAEANQVYIDKSAVKRLGKPEDVAWAVAFLADERSSFVTGETLNVNGGTLMD
jgi:3-oxoacyl-[acyl-carrier protein] reductase